MLAVWRVRGISVAFERPWGTPSGRRWTVRGADIMVRVGSGPPDHLATYAALRRTWRGSSPRPTRRDPPDAAPGRSPATHDTRPAQAVLQTRAQGEGGAPEGPLAAPGAGGRPACPAKSSASTPSGTTITSPPSTCRTSGTSGGSPGTSVSGSPRPTPSWWPTTGGSSPTTLSPPRRSSAASRCSATPMARTRDRGRAIRSTARSGSARSPAR